MRSSVSGRKNHDDMLLVTASLLLIVLIYSSVSEVDIFARPPKVTMDCFKTGPTLTGAAYAETCCQSVGGKTSYCVTCEYDANGNGVGACIGSAYRTRQPIMGNSTAPAGTLLPPSGNNSGTVTNGPPHLGTVLPSGSNNNTGTPPAKIITKEHNAASPNVISSTGNPSANTGQNQQNSENLHHKGSGTSSSNPSTSSSSSSSGSSSGGGSTGSKSSTVKK
jgi:uncharacterized membrane protein YgcG